MGLYARGGIFTGRARAGWFRQGAGRRAGGGRWARGRAAGSQPASQPAACFLLPAVGCGCGCDGHFTGCGHGAVARGVLYCFETAVFSHFVVVQNGKGVCEMKWTARLKAVFSHRGP
jgi:hypothetical protein